MILEKARRVCWCLPILAITFPVIGSSASQLAPFFEGLKAVHTVEGRKAWFAAERHSPDSLVLSEELPALVTALRDSDPLANYVAGQYLSYLAYRNQRNPDARDGLRRALPALTAHFNDPNPNPCEEVTPFTSTSKERRWQDIVLSYLRAARLSVPPDLIPSVKAALRGPHFKLAIEDLALSDPLTPDIIGSLLAVLNDPRNPAAQANVLTYLSEVGVTDPRFIQAINDALSSPDVEVLTAATTAAYSAGIAASSLAPRLQRVAEGSTSEQARSTARMALAAIEAADRHTTLLLPSKSTNPRHLPMPINLLTPSRCGFDRILSC